MSVKQPFMWKSKLFSPWIYRKVWIQYLHVCNIFFQILNRVATDSKVEGLKNITFGSRIVRQSTKTSEMEIDPSSTNTRKVAQLAAHDPATLVRSYDYSRQDAEAVETCVRIRQNRAVAAAQKEPAPEAGNVENWLE